MLGHPRHGVAPLGGSQAIDVLPLPRSMSAEYGLGTGHGLAAADGRDELVVGDALGECRSDV